MVPPRRASSSPARGHRRCCSTSPTAAAERLAFAVYGGSLILLYAASTLYHALPLPSHRLRPLRTLDHIAIYFLIAGTYTPVAIVTLHGPSGWALLAAAWAIALAGVPFKIWWLDAPVWFSTATYLAMGYMALLAAAPLAARGLGGGLAWLVAGGIAYTVGAVIFTPRAARPIPGSVRPPRDLAPPGAGGQRLPLRVHAAPRRAGLSAGDADDRTRRGPADNAGPRSTGAAGVEPATSRLTAGRSAD